MTGARYASRSGQNAAARTMPELPSSETSYLAMMSCTSWRTFNIWTINLENKALKEDSSQSENDPMAAQNREGTKNTAGLQEVMGDPYLASPQPLCLLVGSHYGAQNKIGREPAKQRVFVGLTRELLTFLRSHLRCPALSSPGLGL